MLTPKDIQDVGFAKSVFGGYDMEAVDDFLEVVVSDYAKLYKDNAVLKTKIKVLVDKIEEYRQTEDSMRMALLTAQRTSEELLNRAKDKSTSIVAGAEAQAEAKLHEIEKYIAMENARLIKSQQDAYEFVRRSRELMEMYDAVLSKMETTEILFPENAADADTQSSPAPVSGAPSGTGPVYENYVAPYDSVSSENESAAEECDPAPEYRPAPDNDEPTLDIASENETQAPEQSEQTKQAEHETVDADAIVDGGASSNDDDDMFGDIESAIIGRLNAETDEPAESAPETQEPSDPSEDPDATKRLFTAEDEKRRRDLDNLRFGSNYDIPL